MPVAQHLSFKLIADTQLIALVEQVCQPVAESSTGIHQRTMPCLSRNTQRNRVVAVERVPGDKRQLTLGAHVYHAEIAGFQQEVAVFDMSASSSPSSEEACTSAKR